MQWTQNSLLPSFHILNTNSLYWNIIFVQFHSFSSSNQRSMMHPTLDKNNISASDLGMLCFTVYRSIHDSSCFPDAITSIFETFLRDIDYRPQALQDTNVQLEKAMHNEMQDLDICCDQLERTLHLAASFVEVTSCRHSIVSRGERWRLHLFRS